MKGPRRSRHATAKATAGFIAVLVVVGVLAITLRSSSSSRSTTSTTIYSLAQCHAAINAAEAYMAKNTVTAYEEQLSKTGSSPFTALHENVLAQCSGTTLNTFLSGPLFKWTRPGASGANSNTTSTIKSGHYGNNQVVVPTTTKPGGVTVGTNPLIPPTYPFSKNQPLP